MWRLDPPSESFMQFVVSVWLGIARAILTPNNRGLVGFFAVFIVAMGCGVVSGIISLSFGLSSGWQYIITAFCTLVGQDAVKFLINFSLVKTQQHITNNVNRVEGDFVGNDKDETNE